MIAAAGIRHPGSETKSSIKASVMGSTARVRTSTTAAGQTLTTAMSTAIRTFRAISETPTVKASAVAMTKQCLTSRAEADVAETVRAELGKYGSSTQAIAVSTWQAG
jgi:hypothetical protein